ncbi:ATP-grasp domain-containing protein [Streptomyces asiaticus]|uniref:ATP-grasp domain-containing protein n=1 Tax=Streptomyces asiaticus TaxID=114695 RepID=UPI003F6749CA
MSAPEKQAAGPGQVIAVVDPVAVAIPYGREAAAMGLSAIAVLTQEFRTPYVVDSFDPHVYRQVHRLESIADTIAYLKHRRVAAVVPGTQTALDVVDVLADGLRLIGNPVESVRARADKRTMKEYWQAHSVPCAAFLESDDLRSVLAWAESIGYPVVLKPSASSGSSHVFVCTDEREVAAAFQVITTRPDLYHRRFATVLAEEYLDGDEYFMNLLHDGEKDPPLVSLARYEKIQRDGHASIYRNVTSMPLDDALAIEVLPYIRAANAAVDVRFGINDTEFKMTSRGPRAVEINNRLPGASTPLMIQKCSGLNTFQENIRIFMGQYTRLDTYAFRRHYCVCCLINDSHGHVIGHSGEEDVRRLPSFDGMRLIAAAGRPWPATRDLTTAWGLVRLVHEDRDQLARDAEAVHGLMRLIVE